MAACLSLSDACDPNWHHSRDGLIISGFLFSILFLILAIILLIILIIHNQMVRIYMYSFNEISIMNVCTLWPFKFSFKTHIQYCKTKSSYTCEIYVFDGSVTELFLTSYIHMYSKIFMYYELLVLTFHCSRVDYIIYLLQSLKVVFL